MSHGKVVLVAGKTGAGKTTFIKNKFASKVKKIVAYATMASDFSDFGKIKVYNNFMQLVDETQTEGDILILVDEAWTCLPKKLNISLSNTQHPHNRLSRWLVNSRKMNRWIVFPFHSCNQIPSDWLLGYSDYFIRFTTQDQLQYQIQRFKSFPNIADSFKEKPVLDQYEKVILKLR